MRMLISVYSLCIVLFFFMSCSDQGQIKNNEQSVNIASIDNQAAIENTIASNVHEKEYNFKFVGYDINIDDPELDRRSYFKIFIDKLEAGRTTIGLESQKKTFELRIPSNRHLLIVEKWVLDEKKGQYVKLNNIEQPKPGYLYFNLPEDKIAVVVLKNDPLNNKSEFQLEFEN